MTFYLDTSALVKRYLLEPGSAAVRALFRRRRTIAVSRIAYAELAAALARACRAGVLSEAARDAILSDLDEQFAQMTVVEVRATVVQLVPAIAIRHGLRGYDAVQLACAVRLQGQGVSVHFWAADRDLVAAARAEGLRATLVG